MKGHYSVRSDPPHPLTVNGKELRRDGKPFKGNADGIALSPEGQWLYYKALSDTKLYRIRTEDLRNVNLSKRALESKVEDLGASFSASDGMIFDPAGNLYLSDFEHDAIVRVSPQMKLETVVSNPRLIWPDTFAWGADGSLHVACSQIQNMPWCQAGRDLRSTPYTIYRLKPE